ncbi:MAG TPA: branched-chain amino acid ABC transporter permease, partial [Alphaproteobacteria bacterium]|nr:branched-chain amino acid ABC transporter permease [Alphaproteobacteria bacterium]
MLAYSILAGLVFGLYFSLVGLGLNLVFGVMRIVNLAHGDFLMLGAFAAYWLFNLFGINPLAAAIVAFVFFAILGIPLYYAVVPRLLKAKDPEMLSIILFFGLSQMIEALATIAFGPGERSIPGKVLGSGPVGIFGQSLPSAWIVSGVASGVAV